MACLQTLTGIANDCAASMGGIVEAYIANRADVEAVTFTTNKVTGITMASGKTFKTYTFRRNTGSMTSNYQIDEAAGTQYVETDLVLQFNKMETAKRIEITALAQGELAVLVKDANGAYWMLGIDNPVKAAAGDGVTGTQRADRNGYSITLREDSLELPAEVLVGTDGVNLASIVS